jgi:hypothetical protein
MAVYASKGSAEMPSVKEMKSLAEAAYGADRGKLLRGRALALAFTRRWL